jgi:hypothetical protein
MMRFENMSAFDRAVRVAVGVLMLAAGWAGLPNGVWQIGLEVFGWVPLATGVVGWCPVYALLGLRTNRPKL